MIEFKNVSYTYFNNYYPLFNFSYSFDKGSYCLVGDYDLGNLTLIRLLAKLDSFYKGEILINGKSLKKTNYKKDFNVAYISRTPAFFNNKSVIQNLAYPLRARNVKKQERERLINQVLEKYGWQDKANIKVKNLSQYERIMLAIMRADTRPLDLLLVEDIFDIIQLESINNLLADIKIVVSKTDIDAKNFVKLQFKLGEVSQIKS